jgi:hypothetical protein
MSVVNEESLRIIVLSDQTVRYGPRWGAANLLRVGVIGSCGIPPAWMAVSDHSSEMAFLALVVLLAAAYSIYVINHSKILRKENQYAEPIKTFKVRRQKLKCNLRNEEQCGPFLLADVISTTEGTMGMPSSEELAPTEDVKRKRMVFMLLVIAFGAIGGALLFMTLTLAAILQDQSYAMSRFAVKGGSILLGLLVAGFLSFRARNQKKTAGHVLKYDARPPIVFLRSFGDEDFKLLMALDRGKSIFQPITSVSVEFESAIEAIFAGFGPFIALGSGKDVLPRLGATREYVTDSQWQEKVIEWMERAQFVVFLIGTGEGVQWEIGQIQKRNLTGKCIFIFPPGEDRSLVSIPQVRPFFQSVNFNIPFGRQGTSEMVALWASPNGPITVLTGRRKFLQDYELALRIAIYDLKYRRTR